MLIAAAAERWKVSPGALQARDHAVWNGRRSLPFGELADAAGKLPVPKARGVKFRSRQEVAHVYRPRPLLRGAALATGPPLVGSAVRLQRALGAVVARPPT